MQRDTSLRNNPSMVRTLKLALLYLSKALGLFCLARWLTRGKLRILGYHGFSLGDEHQFRPGLFIQPDVFRQRMAYLARTRIPVLRLDEALERLQARELPPCATAITIDDGFYSVYDRAAPVLAEFGFPATVYVTSYYGQRSNPVFRLAVQYLFWQSEKSQARGAHATSPGLAPDQRHQAMWSLIQEGVAAGDEARRVALCQALAQRLGADYEELRQSRRLSLMTAEELRRLVAVGWDVQLHTHRHRLSTEPAEAAREIEENRAFLRTISDRPLVHFCYPSGQWSTEHWPILAGLGIQSAVTCDPGFNGPSTPRLALRRTLDSQHMAQIEFEAAVSGFTELWRAARRLWSSARNAQRSSHGCCP